MAPSSITARNFQQEDLPQVIELYKRTSIKNPHFIRNEVFLNHFMNDLSTNKGGAFVTETDGRITGFAIVSITIEQGGLKQGNILELQVTDIASLRALIQAASDHCRLNDVDSIVTVAPLLPKANEVLKDWLKFGTGVMMAKPLSPAPLLEALLSSERTRSLYKGKKVAFHIGTNVFNVEITPEEAHVFQNNAKRNKTIAQVYMSPEVFFGLVVGQLNPYTAYLTRKIRVKGTTNKLSLLRLLYLMRIDSPFFTSLADRM